MVRYLQDGKIQEAKSLFKDLLSHMKIQDSDGGNSEGTLPVRLQVWKAILEHEVEGKYEEAKKVYDSVLAKNDTMKLAMLRRIAIEKARKDWKSASNLLSLYLEIFMGDIDAWLELSRIYIGFKNFQMAAFCLEEAILIRPQDYCLFIRYAEINYAMGTAQSVATARDYFAKVVNLIPQHPRSLFGLLQCNRVLKALLQQQQSNGLSASVEKEIDEIDREASKKLEKLQYDYENYIVSLYLPGVVRDVFWVVRAFNAETASLGSGVGVGGYNRRPSPQNSDNSHQVKSSLALMRLQYWKDEINSIYSVKSVVSKNPVTFSLNFLVHEAGLSLSQLWFTRILNARTRYWSRGESPFATVTDMVDYAENTATSLLYLVLESYDSFDGKGYLSREQVSAIHHYTAHVGKCAGLLTLLNGIHDYSQRERVFPLPTDLLQKYRLVEQDFFTQEVGLEGQEGGLAQEAGLDKSGNSTLKPWNDLFFEIASEANGHLEAALKERQSIFGKRSTSNDDGGDLVKIIRPVDLTLQLCKMKTKRLLEESTLSSLRQISNPLAVGTLSLMYQCWRGRVAIN